LGIPANAPSARTKNRVLVTDLEGKPCVVCGRPHLPSQDGCAMIGPGASVPLWVRSDGQWSEWGRPYGRPTPMTRTECFPLIVAYATNATVGLCPNDLVCVGPPAVGAEFVSPPRDHMSEDAYALLPRRGGLNTALYFLPRPTARGSEPPLLGQKPSARFPFDRMLRFDRGYSGKMYQLQERLNKSQHTSP